MAITRPQLHDAIVQTKEYIDKNVSELQDKIYSRGGYVIVDSLPVQNVQMDKTYLVPKVDSNGYAISGSYLEYVYAVRYNSGTTITNGLIDLLYDKFIKMLPNSGTYAFVYDNDIWKYNNETVVLYDYGITILDGTPVQDDTITVSVSNGSWEPLGDATLDLSGYYDKTDIDGKVTTINNSISATNAEVAKKEDIFRYTTMPSAVPARLNKIIQYVGETNNSYKQGYYYKCVLDEENDSITIPNMEGSGNWWSPVYRYDQDFTISLIYYQAHIYINGTEVAGYGSGSAGTSWTGNLPAGSTFQVNLYNGRWVRNIKLTGQICKWIQHSIQPDGTTINSLNDINDVDISEPGNNQVIAYNEETDSWENKTINVDPSSIIDDTMTSVNNTWSANKISENLNNKQDKTQYSIMPTPSAKYLNKTIQYVGTTDDNYINSYFYKCEYNEENDEYKWNNKLTQPSTEIDDIDGLPSGGTQGQILIKQSLTDGDADWNDIPKENQTISLADFNALPQSEKDNGTAYYIYDAEAMSNFTVMGNRFDKANIYTEDERMIGSYLGKPLYQKTIDFGSEITISNVSMTPTSISVDSLGCDKIISADGVRDDGLRTSFTAVCSSSYVELLAMRDGNSVSTRYLTLQYTKTADATVNIGTGNDYSTDEQIIGTWIDGKKLYQKVLQPSSTIVLSSDYVNIHDVASLNIECLIRADLHRYPNDGNSDVFTDYVNGYIRAKSSTSGASYYANGFTIIQYTKTED